MRNKAGIVSVLLGVLLILGALGLFLFNQAEAEAAGRAVDHLIPRLQAEITRRQIVAEDTDVPETPTDGSTEMPQVEIDGYAYIGYLSIPGLELELPVMAQWDDTRLRIAPCRYTGTVDGGDLVIMAHNYARHFGRLSKLTVGDSVVFRDMNGVAARYAVVSLDVLEATAVEEMTGGDCDLTLFTCTYGGKSRVRVCCDRVENG